MLNFLQIKNFTIIEDITIDFKAGFNVITGETGSGKSLVFDALYLILGNRVSDKVISPNKDTCTIVAQFDINTNKQAQDFLLSNNICTSECVIKRLIYRNKASKCEINGEIVSQKQLKGLTKHLMHIHSQHESYKLVDQVEQKEILDNFSDNNPLLTELKSCYVELSSNKENLIKLQEIALEQQDRLDITEYHLEELYKLNLGENSFSELKTEYNQQSSLLEFEKLLTTNLGYLRDDGDSCLSRLESIAIKGEKYNETFPSSKDYLAFIDNAIIQVEEAYCSARNLLQSNSYDKDRIIELEEQLNLRQELARKHNTSADNLENIVSELEKKKEELLNISVKIESLSKEINKQEQAYRTISEKIYIKRRESANKISTKVLQYLPKLGIPKGEFAIDIKHEVERYSIDGQDSIQFLFNANPGHELSPIGNVASGGEISRISLIIELITLSDIPKGTILFDEVDTGVSGKVARDIGFMLKDISNYTQVMCITHLPQIASLATTNYTVEKNIIDNNTLANVKKLDHEEKVFEVARLLDGTEVTQSALTQAAELCKNKYNIMHEA
jgi:DNA repair protein RecN (Recombination protein N)